MTSRKSRLDRLSRLNFFEYPKREARPPSPRETASFIQVIFVSWILPLLRVGMRREITEDDLFPTLFDDQSDHIGDKLEILWGNHVEACKAKKKKPNLVAILWKAFALKFFFFGIFSLAEEAIFRMVQVISIGYVLDYFEGNYLTTLTGTVLFGVGGILLGSVSFLASFHWSIFNMHHVCTHIRIGLSSMVYRKILHLNHASLRSSTVGQIVTMISSDLHRFDRKHIQLNYTWVAPIHLMVVIYILYFHYHYGVTSLIGLFVLIFFTIIQYIMAKKFLHMRQKRVDSADKRIRTVVEIINAFYTIKLHCWECFFEQQAMENRNNEIKILKTTMFLKLLNTAIGFVVTKVSVFLTLLIAFIFEEPGKIHSKRVFVTLVLYEHVRVNSMILFPQGINDVAELLCSCRRITEFLSLEEMETPTHSEAIMQKVIGSDDKSPRIEVDNLSCRWIEDDEFQLKDISFKARSGQLVVIAGPIGSGKSTLISAILGEITPDKGQILVVGRVAYVPQTPSIFPGSIKRNIIFGYGINANWYQQVIKMCDLERDFDQLPNGDQSPAEFTLLSAAQRTKICIARAVYSNADVYLLDDPLYSLDAKYHRLLLDTVIQGALSDKVVLLVSHQIHFMEEATDIILIVDGQVEDEGTYQSLMKRGIEFYRDLERDTEFHFKESEEDLEEESEIAQFLQVPLSRARSIGNIEFEVDELQHVKRIMEKRRDTDERSFIISGSDLQKGVAPSLEPSVVDPNISMVIADEEAFNERDIIQAPAKVSLGLYYDFLRAGASGSALLFLLLVCICSQTLVTMTDIWLEEWALHEEERRSKVKNGTEHEDDTTRLNQILKYSVLNLLIVTFSFGRSFLIYKICLKASSAIFEKLLKATIEARMRFFEHTCAGNAINRLSKDMVIIDDLIPPTLLEVLAILFEICGALLILAFANPWFIIPASAYFISIMTVYKIYHLTAADLKRMEGRARSPVYSHLSKTLQGVSTIRAFGQEQAFVMIFDRLQDNHTASWYLFLSAQSWLAVIIDCISIVLIASISMSFFYLDTVTPAIVGLAISKMIELSITVQFAAGEIANTETQMISVERVLEYTQPYECDQFEIFSGPNAPEDWPFLGQIKIIHLSLKTYSGHHRKSLKGFNLRIEGGQWVGIVGKAGSGKTTLFNALFRTGEVESGQILIDGVDISGIGLHNLRSKISIIPQAPCMFHGTVRQNIDPLNRYTDKQIWDILKECLLFNVIRNMRNGLDSNVSEYGANFSPGQRQFICLARALLERNKIICCDEPTASLDGYSQMVMVCKLKEYFANSTMLLISHRIHSVMDCDRIIVMDAGEIIDDGEPYDLLMNKNGPFYEMVSHLGKGNYDDLVDMAKDARNTRMRHVKSKSVAETTVKRKSALVRNISIPAEVKKLQPKGEDGGNRKSVIFMANDKKK